MITKTPSFQTSDGTHFATLEFAQRSELGILLGFDGPATHKIIDNAEAIIEILRSTGRKPRKKKAKIGRPKGSRSKESPAEKLARTDRTAKRVVEQLNKGNGEQGVV